MVHEHSKKKIILLAIISVAFLSCASENVHADMLNNTKYILFVQTTGGANNISSENYTMNTIIRDRVSGSMSSENYSTIFSFSYLNRTLLLHLPDDIPPEIIINLLEYDLTWMEFNWSINDSSATNVTHVWLVRTVDNTTRHSDDFPAFSQKIYTALHNGEYYTLYVNATDAANNTAISNITAATIGAETNMLGFIPVAMVIIAILYAFLGIKMNTEHRAMQILFLLMSIYLVVASFASMSSLAIEEGVSTVDDLVDGMYWVSIITMMGIVFYVIISFILQLLNYMLSKKNTRM